MSSGYVEGCIGTDPMLKYTAIPSGGAVSLNLLSLSTANWQLNRFVNIDGNLVSGVALTLPTPVLPKLKNTPANILVVDCGDGTSQPLNPSLTYVYQFTNDKGTVSTPALPVGANIQIVQDDLTYIILRILKSGLVSLAVPAEFKNKPSVLHAMPIDGQPKLPIITVNQSYIGQTHVPLGTANENVFLDNRVTKTALMDRIYSVAVLTTTVEEREFYRDAIIGIFTSILGPVLQKMGQDTSHDIHVDSGQVTKDTLQPGFYFAEAMIKISGSFNVIVTSDYGIIAQIDPEPTEV